MGHQWITARRCGDQGPLAVGWQTPSMSDRPRSETTARDNESTESRTQSFVNRDAASLRHLATTYQSHVTDLCLRSCGETGQTHRILERRAKRMKRKDLFH